MKLNGRFSRLRSTLLLAGLIQLFTAGGMALAQTPDKDTQLADKVRAEIAKHSEFKPDHVDIKVHDGIVHLRGHVDTQLEISEVGKIAKQVKGVKSVMNDLAVDNN